MLQSSLLRRFVVLIRSHTLPFVQLLTSFFFIVAKHKPTWVFTLYCFLTFIQHQLHPTNSTCQWRIPQPSTLNIRPSSECCLWGVITEAPDTTREFYKYITLIDTFMSHHKSPYTRPLLDLMFLAHNLVVWCSKVSVRMSHIDYINLKFELQVILFALKPGNIIGGCGVHPFLLRR